MTALVVIFVFMNSWLSRWPKRYHNAIIIAGIFLIQSLFTFVYLGVYSKELVPGWLAIVLPLGLYYTVIRRNYLGAIVSFLVLRTFYLFTPSPYWLEALPLLYIYDIAYWIIHATLPSLVLVGLEFGFRNKKKVLLLTAISSALYSLIAHFGIWYGTYFFYADITDPNAYTTELYLKRQTVLDILKWY